MKKAKGKMSVKSCPAPCGGCAMRLISTAAYINSILDSDLVDQTFSPTAYVYKCECGWTYTTKYDRAGCHKHAPTRKARP